MGIIDLTRLAGWGGRGISVIPSTSTVITGACHQAWLGVGGSKFSSSLLHSKSFALWVISLLDWNRSCHIPPRWQAVAPDEVTKKQRQGPFSLTVSSYITDIRGEWTNNEHRFPNGVSGQWSSPLCCPHTPLSCHAPRTRHYLCLCLPFLWLGSFTLSLLLASR